MTADATDTPIAILAGGGRLPELVTAAALRAGRSPVVFAIAGEAEPERFAPAPVHVVRWGGLGHFIKLTREAGCREAVFIGSITHRPNYRTLVPDFGTLKLLPEILWLMRGRDGSLLNGVANMFEKKGMRVVSPLSLAPELALPEGVLTGGVSAQAEKDIAVAMEAAHDIGRLDIAQGAVAIGGKIAAVEDHAGTDAMLKRVAARRRNGEVAVSGGVLAKRMKPVQDGRHDLPTIGPQTADMAARAGLAGVVAEAGRAILVGREETIDSFARAGLFLLGLKPSSNSEHG